MQTEAATPAAAAQVRAMEVPTTGRVPAPRTAVVEPATAELAPRQPLAAVELVGLAEVAAAVPVAVLVVAVEPAAAVAVAVEPAVAVAVAAVPVAAVVAAEQVVGAEPQRRPYDGVIAANAQRSPLSAAALPGAISEIAGVSGREVDLA
jgi:hypothetical protein